jgi:4-hydroxy-tetrahydrodipicolinate reductase
VIRVAVIGAAGRMGRFVCELVAMDPELSLVAAVSPAHAGQPIGPIIGRPEVDVVISGELDELVRTEAEVAVDFTRPEAVMGNIVWIIGHGLHAIVGTTGVGVDRLEEIKVLLADGDGRSNVLVAPNFAIGAVLLQRFAAEAALFFPAAEIIELHHEGKRDAPSGTALATAARMEASRQDHWTGPTGETVPGVRGGLAHGIRMHSVRLPGLVAHQEVIFGGQGQTLTLRHDSTDRSSFMPGVLLAIKTISTRPGLNVGLESLLFA